MSIDSEQSGIQDLLAPETHLTSKLESGGSDTHEPDPENGEWYCRDCHARVTVSSTSRKEYGHQRKCQYHLNVGSQQ